MDPHVEPAVTYKIDSLNVITHVGGQWWPFARDNDAPELAPESVIGRDLLDYITGHTPRYLWELILTRVRIWGRGIMLPGRCDSPEKRRFIEIRLAVMGDQGIEFESRTVKEEPRAPIALLNRFALRSDSLLRMCSWCKHVEVEQEWVEVEEAITRLHLLETDYPPSITHGICPSCQQMMMDAKPPD